MKEKTILVIGGGISGITAGVELAEVGHNVILIEKLPYLGGRVIKMNQYFPKLCPPYCGLEINFKRIRQNPRIQRHTSTIVENISGSKGDFTVTLKSQPTYVNDNCTACGDCEKVCPVDRPDEFNYEMTKTKAIYLPHELAFPMKYAIDDNTCLKDNCKKCPDVCKYNAIDFGMQSHTFKVNVSSVIFATGWQPYEASKLSELSYGFNPNIITNVQMERLAAPNGPFEGKILRPSDQAQPKSITFVQCAGSRDVNHLSYCSAVCCSASLKQALNFREQNPKSIVKIFYIDLRVSGRNEDLLNKVIEDEKIELIKGKVAKIKNVPESQNLLVVSEDIMSGRKLEQEVEMVVLATGMVPNNILPDQVSVDEFGFADPFIANSGIHYTGCMKRPLDVSSSIKDATGIALLSIQH